ncbi:MAG TPA: type II toxin-antitoxin system VapC family toxin [Burkholderiaceae bacterium]|jgi:predicted nucleic acid-binding protein|nr:type II toxin-antitoxin system VapC family toxin [Burkholderiaceae bacterium]
MVYVDTSALVPVFIQEPKSEAVVAWLESSGARLAISEWSLVEFASAASIKVRSGRLTANLARDARARVDDFAKKHCLVALPGQQEYRRAAEWAGNDALKLRAADALHLAIADSLRAEAILCLDDGMIESATSLGISVVSL